MVALLAWYVSAQVQWADSEERPGFLTLMSRLDWVWFGWGTLAWMGLLLIVTMRWVILLKAAGLSVGYWMALRLCFVGYFFNNALPGLTGGDLVRAVMIAKQVGQHRARAAVSVFVDRGIGLVGLLILGTCVLSFADFDGEQVPSRLGDVHLAVASLLACAFLGAYLWISRRMRRLLRLDTLLAKLPLGDKVAAVDDAITLYRRHPLSLGVALMLSIGLQALGALSFWCMGAALGGGLDLVDIFAVYPVVQTASSVPVAPAGWGIGESLYGAFFRGFGSTFTLGVAVSVLFRLTTQIGFGLLGGLAWIGLRDQAPSQTSS